MNRLLAFLLFFILPLVALAAAPQLYTCGMHPQIIRTEPGDCPVCGMRLTPVSATGANIQIDAAMVQRMNLKTAVIESGPVRRELRTVGVVAYDERSLRDVTAKYEGWIEQLHVDASWTAVQAGEPLFDIYSPDLYNAQLNYLVAWRSEGALGGPLTRAAVDRLRLYDVPESFVTELGARGTVERTFRFVAPADGVVIEKMVVQGQMMRPGEVIFRLADLSQVWVEARIYENDLPFVHEGQDAEVRITFGPEKHFAGKITRLVPEIDAATRTVVARIVVKNSDGFLRPGMYADVRLSAQLADSAVLVPDLAVLRSGERNTVFVALADGFFEPRDVKLGVRAADHRYEVLSGLAAGERVVTSGQFLLDSESQLREGIQKMLHGEGGAAPSGQTEPGPATPGAPTEHVH